MPALSFQGRWLDPLLSGRKKQTTRANDRIKVGSIVHIYNQQRVRITAKPLRKTTFEGRQEISYRINNRGYPMPVELEPYNMSFELSWYYAHFLGKVEISEVYSIRPSKMRGAELEIWAMMWSYADGFDSFLDANEWFKKNYGDDWMDRTWYVIRWDGWLERYFEAKTE